MQHDTAVHGYSISDPQAAQFPLLTSSGSAVPKRKHAAGWPVYSSPAPGIPIPCLENHHGKGALEPYRSITYVESFLPKA